MSKGIELAVIGAAGVNGDNLLQVIAQQGLPLAGLYPLDSNDYLGKSVDIGGKVKALSDYDDFDYSVCDLALVCKWVPASVIERIRAQGCTLVAPLEVLPDADRELMVADVNGDRLAVQKGDAIAVPSAQSAILATLLSPLHDELGIGRADAVWVRAVSNDGRQAIEGLAGETAQLLNGQGATARVYPEKIAFNLLAKEGGALERDFQTLWRDLWGDEIEVSIAESVAPVFFGDLLHLSFECEQPTDIETLEGIFSAAKGVRPSERGQEIVLSSNASVAGDAIDVADIRALGSGMRRFSIWASVDAPRFGLAINLVNFSNILAKKLFISYS